MDGGVRFDGYVLRVSPQELQIIVEALHERPYRIVAPLLGKMQGQVTEQDNIPAESSFGTPPKNGETPV